MFKILICMFFVASAVSAYDFSDSEFNEYLFEELRAEYDDSLESLMRNRRDVDVTPSEDKKECGGRREWKKNFECCKGDKIEPEKFEVYMIAKKQCQVEIRGNNTDESYDPFNCQKMQQAKEQMVCISECVSKKFDLIDEKGELKRDAILIEMRKKVADVEWKAAAVEGIVDKCLTEVKEKKEKSSIEVMDNKACNRCPLEFHHCIWREFSNSCPADLRVDSTKCNKIRERLSKGETFLNKHYLHQLKHMRHEE